MRIAVLATVTDFGGAERVVLSSIDHANSTVCELVPILFTTHRLDDRTFFEHLDSGKKKYHTIFVDAHKIKYFNPLLNVLEAYQLLKKNEFDLIHSHCYRANVLGVILSRMTGLPVIATCHGSISNDLYLTFYNKLERFVLRFANKVIAVSQGIKKDLIESGVKEPRVVVIENAVAFQSAGEINAVQRRTSRTFCGATENDFVIGYIGRLSEEKGLRYLLEAVSTNLGDRIPIKLLIVGEGPQREELESLAQKLGIRDNVVFAGFQSNVESWLAAMDLFVLPSLTEGTPMSLLEAMAKGVPVIASAVGGVPQVIDSDKNGMLVPSAKPLEIAKAVRFLYDNKDVRVDLAKKAQITIRDKYDINVWIDKIETEYRKVLKK